MLAVEDTASGLDIAAFIVSAIAIFVAIAVGRYARQQANAAIDQAVEAGKQADSANDQALSAREQADIANRQLALSEQIRREQSEPYITVDIVPSPIVSWVFLLVIENIGPTMARNVRITFNPPIQRVRDSDGRGALPMAEASMFREGIALMPPRRRIELFFDRTFDLVPSDLPKTYTVTVEADGPFGAVEPLTYKIDLNMYDEGYDRISPKNLHDGVQTLDKILTEIKKIRTEITNQRANEVAGLSSLGDTQPEEVGTRTLRATLAAVLRRVLARTHTPHER
ncbi:hypothetical protein [Nonomuraea lactucae]|uniref:hypothetical protein n=1 Tax=Nonomuraea lactucae TaxID=2249762 RepID=UPI0013B3AD2A|nr:hypothetical protein [Nonomuraea lactucae]